jgi:hypothetical protein
MASTGLKLRKAKGGKSEAAADGEVDDSPRASSNDAGEPDSKAPATDAPDAQEVAAKLELDSKSRGTSTPPIPGHQ